MQKFVINILSSALGTFLAIMFSLFCLVLIFISTAIFTGKQLKNKTPEAENKIDTKYVIKITLQHNIKERPSIKKQILNILEKNHKVHTLTSLTKLIKIAKKTKNIKGIYLKIHDFNTSWSVLKNIKKQLLDFKKSGKFIIVFSYSLSEKNYLLASVADKIILYPEAYIEWNGFHTNFTSIKELLEKAKIKFYVFKTGKFKSAVEPLTNKTISKENRLQLQSLLNKLWKYFLNDIARPNINKNILNYLAKNYFYLSPKEALKYNLIDNIGPEWKAFSIINKYLNNTELAVTPNFYKVDHNTKQNSFSKLFANIRPSKQLEDHFGSKSCIITNNKKNKLCKKNNIAILYLDGEIQHEKTQDTTISSLNTIQILREIAKNKDIKALVLRINSPGGSALASDIIWAELENLKKKIPIVSSFASVAASGAYYLAAGSNFIFSETTSIVGSIGVFFVRPYTGQLTQSLGIYNQDISTHNNVELFNNNTLLTPLEKKRIDYMLQATYDKFKFVIQKGRNLSEKKAASLATGRYWLGEQAVSLDLVDKIGGLTEAVKKAASLAKIDIYSTQAYPKNLYFDFNFNFLIQHLFKSNTLTYVNNLFKKNTILKHLYLTNISKLDPKGILVLLPEQISYKDL